MWLGERSGLTRKVL